MSVEGQMGARPQPDVPVLCMFAVFAVAQLATGFAEYNAEHANQGLPPLTLQAYSNGSSLLHPAA